MKSTHNFLHDVKIDVKDAKNIAIWRLIENFFWSIEKWTDVLEKSKLHLKLACLIPLIINLFVKFFSFLISLQLYVLLLLFVTESDIAGPYIITIIFLILSKNRS